MEKRTHLINYRHARETKVHNLILERIHSNKGKQSLCVSLVETNGTPNNLTGRELVLKPKRVHKTALNSSSTLEKKKWLLFGFVTSLHYPTKTSKAFFTILAKSIYAR